MSLSVTICAVRTPLVSSAGAQGHERTTTLLRNRKVVRYLVGEVVLGVVEARNKVTAQVSG